MKVQRSLYLTGASVLTLLAACGAAQAQEASASPQVSELSEIVVTATRRAENIQDVPMVVTAITDEAIRDNNIVRFQDVATLSPGLDLRTSSQGPEASLRGVSTVTVSGGPPAVDIYFNESPLNGIPAFRSIYDIGQIEVLRGPQGTLRGDTAPAGAITIATKRPYFNEYGATGDLVVSDRERLGVNAWLGVNIPLITDKLAVRFAGLYGENDNGGTRNVTNGAESKQISESVRASVLYQPINRLEIFGMWQYLADTTRSLARVDGAGMGYNGPAISGDDNRAVQESPGIDRFSAHIGSLTARLDLGAAALSYIGGYRKQVGKSYGGDADFDPGNGILDYGHDIDAFNGVRVKQYTHELRLDSVGVDRFWDYTLGVYQSSSEVDVQSHNPQVALPGAFGDPATASSIPMGPLNPRYVSYLNLRLYSGEGGAFPGDADRSVFASSTFNFPTGTHVRVGARRIWDKAENNFVLDLTPAFIGVDLGFPTAGICPFIPGPGFVASPYPTSCDIPFVGGNLADLHVKREFKDWVYEVNVRQDLTERMMVYFNFNRNWRAPGISQGDVPPQYILADPETSKNYEVGFKGDLFDRRVRITAAAFLQDFKDYNATVSNVPFLSGAGAGATVVDAFSITYNGDAKVRGAELDVTADITNNWNARFSVSYAKGEFENAVQPCRDSDFNGVPDGGTPTVAGFQGAGVNVATCATSGPINGLPEWNYTLQSQYTFDLPRGGEAYVRGLANYKSEGRIVSSAEPVKAYGTLDLYIGAKDFIEGLDVNIFAKNIFDETRKFDQGGLMNTLSVVPTGYRSVFYTPGREIGISVHKSFGGG